MHTPHVYRRPAIVRLASRALTGAALAMAAVLLTVALTARSDAVAVVACAAGVVLAVAAFSRNG